MKGLGSFFWKFLVEVSSLNAGDCHLCQNKSIFSVWLFAQYLPFLFLSDKISFCWKHRRRYLRVGRGLFFTMDQCFSLNETLLVVSVPCFLWLYLICLCTCNGGDQRRPRATNSPLWSFTHIVHDQQRPTSSSCVWRCHRVRRVLDPSRCRPWTCSVGSWDDIRRVEKTLIM